MRIRLLFIVFLIAGAAGAQEVTTLVPVVGTVFGPTMIIWRTDVELVNESALPNDVALELPAAPDAFTIAFTMSPGEVKRFNDIVSEAFGLETALSPLRIISRRPLSVRANAYAMRGAEASPLQPIPSYPSQTWFPFRTLDGLAFSDSFRTNIGLVNFGEQDAEFVLALQRIPGRDLAVTRLRVAPGSIVHTSVQSLFPLITKGEGFLVVVETPARETHVYASVIENVDNAAKFIVPRIGSR
jgi:hypothetical protein